MTTYTSHKVAVISGRTNTVTTTIRAGSGLGEIAVKTGKAYVTGRGRAPGRDGLTRRSGLRHAELLFQEEQKTSRENFFRPAEACGKNCRTVNDVRRRADRGRTNVHVHGEASMARIAIITGAASGIGRALARALDLRGDTVVVADIDGDGAERVAAWLAGQGPGAATSAAPDVRDAAAVAALVRSTHDSHGRLDVMVNNAGIAIGGGGAQVLLAPWDRAIDGNLRGVGPGGDAGYPIIVRQRSRAILKHA